MRGELLFEIGFEELPAGFLRQARKTLAELVERKLAAARLDPESIRVMGTPRRLVVAARGIPDKQPDLAEQVVGPPAQVAFGGDGKPTKAAEGFAKKNGVELSELSRTTVEGKKGEYVVCTRREVGLAATDVLAKLLGEVIAELPWPKSMRWGWHEETFARPVHWFVAKYNGLDLRVEFADVVSGSKSRGHRFLAPGAIAITGDVGAYESALREAFVVVDPAKRRDMIEAELVRIQKETGAQVREDRELLDEVTDLVEYPKAICGEFDASFLEVPEEVVVSAMRSHQRYFAMEDRAGKLVNRFVTISGTVASSSETVRHGNERVLAARLADAQFFFREDRKRDLDSWASQLSGVVFQTKLGTIADKVARMRAVATHLADRVGVDRDLVARVCDLAKADLVTHMVGEFPDLQGTMGRHYAALAGEPEEVARAIEDHYLPRTAQGALPSGAAGAVVGIADRIDTIVGCFAAGLAPSGSADPYGLRRAAVAILGILLDRDWSVPVSELVGWAAAEVEGKVPAGGEVQVAVRDFFTTRLRGIFGATGEEGMPVDCIEAALAAGADDVPDARRRAEAVAQLRQRADFEPLAAAFKRVANILKDQDAMDGPDPEAFVEGDERALWSSFGEIEERARRHLDIGDYKAALQVLAELKAPVDRFFDAVLVMDKDEKVRNNRLALLGRINATFTQIADFRQLAV